MRAAPIKRTISILLVAAGIFCFGGCTFCRQCASLLRSTEHFIPHKSDPRVLLEPGAENYADRIVSFLPSAIQQIENKQYQPFASPVRVYVCASRESFCRMFGMDCRAGVLNKLFLSPRLFDQEDQIVKLYLTHELSHLHLLKKTGVFRMRKLPFWFKEGLATYVSGGGGAHTVTEKQSIEFVRSGKHFVPNETGGLVFRDTPGDWDMEPHMFYRQSMVFVNYLATTNESGFRKLLLSIEDGERFPNAFQAAYNKKLEELWNDSSMRIDNMG